MKVPLPFAIRNPIDLLNYLYQLRSSKVHFYFSELEKY